MTMERVPSLTRDEVIKAIERKKPSRVPLVLSHWWGEGLNEQYGARLKEFDCYPEDVAWVWIPNPVDFDQMKLSWEWKKSGAHDSVCVIDDWAKLDEFIANIPDPNKNDKFAEMIENAEKARKENRYILFAIWNLFFERPWKIRGMENLMCDYYTEKDNVHKLHDAVCKTYCDSIKEAYRLLKPDGFFSSDDLGHQTGPMMSPDIFKEMLFPYYKRLGDTLKQHNMHFWLHSCGDNSLILPHLIEAGVNVFHPVQKHTMDEKETVKKFSGKITFLAGMDVQHTLQEKSPEEIRKEVRFLIDTFDQSDGGMCIGAGNGIVSGTPFENIRAFLDEAVIYGQEHRIKYK